MLPKAEKVSYRALLSIDLSRFLMNTLPTPDFLREGSLWDHMMRIGFPFTTSKFMVSSALSAGGEEVKGQRVCLYGAWESENSTAPCKYTVHMFANTSDSMYC